MTQYWLLVVDIRTGDQNQIAIDEDTYKRETLREMFAVSDVQWPGITVRKRKQYGWAPLAALP